MRMDGGMWASMESGALMRATRAGALEEVTRLAGASGVDVNASEGDVWGRTPLHWAVARGHAGMTAVLAGAPGVDVNRANWLGVTPLQSASDVGHVDVVEALLRAAGVDVNLASKCGQAPLHKAAWGGHSGVVGVLLGAPGIRVDARDGWGATPLRLAVQQGHVSVAKALLEAGADVGEADRNVVGDPLLDVVCKRLPGLQPMECVSAVRRRLGPILLLLLLCTGLPAPLALPMAIDALSDDPSAHLIALLLQKGATR